MKKILAVLLAVIMTAGLLAGCGGGSSESSASASEGKKKTLQVVWFNDGDEGKAFRSLADQYEEEHQDIKIELIEVPYSDIDNKIKNMLNGKEAPALARLSTNSMNMFKNQMVDLSEYLSDKDAFLNNFTDALAFVQDDKIFAAPMDVTANGLIYNKDAFEQAGVSVPQSEDEIWTWDEWKEAMQTVVANSDCKYGLVFDTSLQRFSTLMYEAGGSYLTEDFKASNFNTPEVSRAVTFFKELHDEEIMPESVWLGSDNPNELFRIGQAAMHFSGSWMIANYEKEIEDFEWGVTYLPKEAQRSSVPGGKYLGAFQGSGVEKEATEFIEWISSAENSAAYCLENSYISPVVGNESLEYEFGAEFFEIFSNELAATGTQAGTEWNSQEFMGLVQTDIKDGLVNVLAGKVTVDEFLEESDALITKALEELN